MNRAGLSAFAEYDLAQLDIESPHSVYVLFDGDEVTYIGRTNNLDLRMRAHRHGSRVTPAKSFTRAASLTVDAHEAFLLENAMIRAFNPRDCRTANGNPADDRSVLARHGMAPDEGAASALRERRRQAGVLMHRRMTVRMWTQRRWRSGLQNVLYRAAVRTARRMETAA